MPLKPSKRKILAKWLKLQHELKFSNKELYYSKDSLYYHKPFNRDLFAYNALLKTDIQKIIKQMLKQIPKEQNFLF
jgi:hypothetical protein